MRKLLILLICLALLPMLPAAAEESARTPLFRLTATDENGQETNVGSALLALEGHMLFTGAPMDGQTGLTAYAPDGSAHAVREAVAGGGGLTLLILEEGADVPFGGFSQERIGAGRLVGLTANGRWYDAPVTGATKAVYRGYDVWVVTAGEALRPGSVVVDAEGGLIGLTVAEWGEGEARYVVLAEDALLEAMAAEIQEGGTEWLDAELRYEDGLLVIDWSGCELDGPDENSGITVYVECAANAYYVYYEVEPTVYATYTEAVPGYDYLVWVERHYGEPSGNLSLKHALNIAIPEADDFTDDDFTSECWLAWAPAGEVPDPTAKLPALEEITAETLMDPSRTLYLQVVNTYAVDEEMETTLILALETPEGYVFHTLNGYIFLPEAQEEDVWNADVSELFTRCLMYGDAMTFTPGAYTLSYLIGGHWAGRVTLTIE